MSDGLVNSVNPSLNTVNINENTRFQFMQNLSSKLMDGGNSQDVLALIDNQLSRITSSFKRADINKIKFLEEAYSACDSISSFKQQNGDVMQTLAGIKERISKFKPNYFLESNKAFNNKENTVKNSSRSIDGIFKKLGNSIELPNGKRFERQNTSGFGNNCFIASSVNKGSAVIDRRGFITKEIVKECLEEQYCSFLDGQNDDKPQNFIDFKQTVSAIYGEIRGKISSSKDMAALSECLYNHAISSRCYLDAVFMGGCIAKKSGNSVVIITTKTNESRDYSYIYINSKGKLLHQGSFNQEKLTELENSGQVVFVHYNGRNHFSYLKEEALLAGHNTIIPKELLLTAPLEVKG